MPAAEDSGEFEEQLLQLFQRGLARYHRETDTLLLQVGEGSLLLPPREDVSRIWQLHLMLQMV